MAEDDKQRHAKVTESADKKDDEQRHPKEKDRSDKRDDEQRPTKEDESADWEDDEQRHPKDEEPSGKKDDEQRPRKDNETANKEDDERMHPKEKEPSDKKDDEQMPTKDNESVDKKDDEQSHPKEKEPRDDAMVKEDEPIHAKVKELTSRFKLNEGMAIRLNNVMQKRQSTLDADIDHLTSALEKVSCPMAVIFTKLKELEEGGSVSSAHFERDVEKMVIRFALDQRATADLVNVLRQRSGKRDDILRSVEKHLASSDRPSELISQLIEKIRNDEALGEPPRRARRSRSRDPKRKEPSRRRDPPQRRSRSRRRESPRRSGRDAHAPKDARRGSSREKRGSSKEKSGGSKDVRAYIKEHNLDDRASEALAGAPAEVQQKVMERGDARSMNSAVMSRLKDARIEVAQERENKNSRAGSGGDRKRDRDKGDRRDHRDDRRDDRTRDRRDDRRDDRRGRDTRR